MSSCWCGVAVLIDVAVLVVDARRAAEHSYVGPRGPVGEEQERGADADEEPGQRPEDGHPQQGGERGDEVGTRDPPELAAEALGVRVVEVDQGGHVDELDDRGDHDGGQCRLGQVLEEPGEEEQRHNGQGGRDQPRQLRARTGGRVDRCLGEAAADHHAAAQAGGEVGATQRDEFAVGVDVLVVAGGVGLRRRQSLGERDEHHADAGRGQPPGVPEPDVGQPERGQPARRSTRPWEHRGRRP